MKKILIIDDEEDVLNVLGRRLADTGFRVIRARNGAEGIDKAKKERPNLIILDIWMPGMDGGEVAQRLKQDSQTKDIPIVFLTCLYSKEDEKRIGHDTGKNFVIAKPYNPEELMDILRAHLA